MRLALTIATLAASPAVAERVECTLTAPCPKTGVCVADPVALRFEIDRNQFAPAIDPKEPPRRKVTLVRFGQAEFEAEPMVIGDVIGFWQDNQAMQTRMFTVSPDGGAIYNESPSGRELTGNCEVFD